MQCNIHKSQKKTRKIKHRIKPKRLSNENEDYAYFRKLAKSTSVILCLKLPRVLKFTFVGKEFHTLTSAAKSLYV